MNKKYIVISIFGLLLLVGLPFIGQVKLDIQSLFGENTGSFIFWQLRVPVTILSFIVGSTLALAGLIFQNIFKNSLATPYTLGVSSGAAAASVLAIKLNISISFLGLNGIYLYGFVGALITIFLIIGIAKLVRSFSIYTLLMSGIALNFFFSACILLIQYLSDYAQTTSVLRWLMGSLSVAGYNEILFLLPIYIFFYYHHLPIEKRPDTDFSRGQFRFFQRDERQKIQDFYFDYRLFYRGRSGNYCRAHRFYRVNRAPHIAVDLQKRFQSSYFFYYFYRRSGVGAVGRADFVAGSGCYSSVGRILQFCAFLGIVAHHLARRSLHLQPGTAPLSPAAHLADHLHLGH